jgi:hypothetical protein
VIDYYLIVDFEFVVVDFEVVDFEINLSFKLNKNINI